MSFSLLSQQTIDATWHLARGRCECQRQDHGHVERCGQPIVLHAHGLLREGGWFAVAWTSLADGGADEAENVEALCPACYRRVTQEALAA